MKLLQGLLIGLVLFLSQQAKAETPRVDPPKAKQEISSSPFPFNLTTEQRAELNRQTRMQLARVAAAEGDILTWGQALFPDKFQLPFCRELHEYFVSIRTAEFTNTEAPRGHAKTTIKCFLIPLYQAMVEPLSFRHYLNVQATATKADSVNMAIKLELEENRELIELYGNQVSKHWTTSQFVLSNGTIFSAIGAGQSIRGINYRNIRPDYVLIDDLYDEEDINSPESTEKKNAWFWGSLYKARAIGRRTSMHLQGTAINNYDLMELLKKKERWLSRTFKGVTDSVKKEVLWKELDKASYDSLFADFEDMPTAIFNREIQNERRDDADSIVKRGWLSNWLYDPSDLVFNENHLLVSVELGVDPSIGKTNEADFTGMALIYKTRYVDQPAGVFNYYIVGLWNRHLSLNKRIELMNEISGGSDERIRVAHIEGISGFADFVGEAKRKTNIPVHEVNAVKDKITNLENKSGYFENGRVFVSNKIDPKLIEMLKHQLTTNHPNHDDLRDAVLLVLPELKKVASWRPIA